MGLVSLSRTRPQPVKDYSNAESVELLLNGKSLGRKKKGRYEYRLHWDDVVYEPGELKVVAYKDGNDWATESARAETALVLQEGT